jgi:outer membrane protein assembly factor BamB
LNRELYALNAVTGKKEWANFTAGSVFSSPAVANGVVYAGGNIFALNAITGAEEWAYTTGSDVDSSPAVASGVVFVGSADDNMCAFGLPGGTTGGVRRPGPASQRPGTR